MYGLPDSRRGLMAARFVKALAVARGDVRGAHAFSMGQPWHRDTPRVEELLKAAVTATGSDDAAGLVGGVIGEDLMPLLRARSILGRVTGLHRVPFDTGLLLQASGVTASWVAPGAAKPLSRATFTRSSLTRKSVSGIVVLTDELVRSSNAEAVLMQDVTGALALAEDTALVDGLEATAARPGSVTFGVTPIATGGAAVAQLDVALAAATAALVAAGSTLEFAAWVAHPATAVALSLKRAPDGSIAYPTASTTLAGLPVLTSAAAPAGTLILVDGSRIWVSDENRIEFLAGNSATLEMSDAPAGAGAVSMFQNGLIAIRGEAWVDWKAAPGAAAVVTGVA